MIRILSVSPKDIKINEKDVLYYMGAKGAQTEEVSALVSECTLKTKQALNPMACFDIFPLHIDNNLVNFGVYSVKSHDLAKNLDSCRKAVFFAATVGFETDRLLQRYSCISPAKASCISACAATAIESCCDLVCLEIQKLPEINKKAQHPRFSPGYGDLPLEEQKKIMEILDCRRKIGITLTESMMMIPTKSVTAIVGIEG